MFNNDTQPIQNMTMQSFILLQLNDVYIRPGHSNKTGQITSSTATL